MKTILLLDELKCWMKPIRLDKNHPLKTSYWMKPNLWMKFFSYRWLLDESNLSMKIILLDENLLAKG
jgi:hypothetical protein